MSNKMPELNALIERARFLVPPLLASMHKGQAGRILVVGGSRDYTGSPFFACKSAMIFGADYTTCICEPMAAPVIKSYSPDLIVRPLPEINNSTNAEREKSVTQILSRMHAVVVGPGLGEDSPYAETHLRTIKLARERELPIVLDADAIKLVLKDLDVIRGYKKVVLTPNANEFRLIVKKLNMMPKDPDSDREGDSIENEIALIDRSNKDGKLCERVARALGGVTVLQKGAVDRISDGSDTIVCDITGGKKRVAGQGDLLCGTLATMLAWKDFYLKGRTDSQDNQYNQGVASKQELKPIKEPEATALACVSASAVVRTASRIAFEEKGRATLTSDILDHVGKAYSILLEK